MKPAPPVTKITLGISSTVITGHSLVIDVEKRKGCKRYVNRSIGRVQDRPCWRKLRFFVESWQGFIKFTFEILPLLVYDCRGPRE